MGKAALLALAAFVIASSYYSLASHDGEASTLRATSKHQMTILARNAASAGYGQAKQAIADAGTFDPFTRGGISFGSTYEDASYNVSITSDGETAAVKSIGTISNAADQIDFTIRAVIGRADAAAGGLPPFLTYALATENDLLLNGNVSGYVDDEEATFNANFHTNGHLHVNGSTADVAGFGSYVGAGTSSPTSALASTFQPHYNPDELETAYQSQPVDIPVFDTDAFLEHAEVDQTSPGHLILSGTMDLGGTRDDPYIWHVRGGLTATGGATLHGYVMFVVEEDINVSGNLVAGDDEDESTIALYGGGDVILNGSVQIHGQIYADGDVTFSGTPDVYGSIATRSSAILSGHPNIHYRPGSPALTTIFSGEPDLQLISYFEH